jgi:two-component system sensor histidine kinase HydH
MIRIKPSEAQTRMPRTAAIVIAMLLLAFALNVAAVHQVFAEHSLLGDWQARPGMVSTEEIGVLRQDIGTRIIVRSTASAVVLLCTLGMLWLQQRQLAILRMLHEVKLVALDILSSMDQGVITTDLDNIITGINSAAIRILGAESDCVGKPLSGLSSGSPALVELAQRVAERHAAVWDQDFALERGGRGRRIRADAHVLKDSSGEALGCVMLLRDVTDRVLMEERVRWMEQFLSLGNLASGLHHEIKNPLTALSIHVQLLEKRLGDPASRKPVDELIGVLKSEVRRLIGVLDSFRDFASLQRLTPRPADVFETLNETILLIGPQAVQQQVEVALRRPEVVLPRVLLDNDKFKQAVLNLVINALEAMPEGGQLVLGTSVRDGELLVEVSDTGSGIPTEIQQDLFKPYFSTKGRGTGMGLALSQKVISQHGGRIDFRTGPLGTTFCITLPLEPVASAAGKP